MQGTLKQFDPDARVLSKRMLFDIMRISELFCSAVSWSLNTIDSDNNTIPVGSTNDTAVPFNIYRDVKAIPEDRRSPFSNVTFDPNGDYRIDNITALPIAVLGLHEWDNVDTDIDFAQAVAVSNYLYNQWCHG
jgi:hypothetical protein